MFELRRHLYADVMAVCNSAAACFVRNDAAVPVAATASLRLLNVLSGKSATLGNHSVSLPEGAGVTHWFCAESSSASRSLDHPRTAAEYIKHAGQIPSNRDGYYTQIQRKGGNATTDCEAACSANRTCSGFTEDNKSPERCWLYGTVAALESAPGDSWYQKPGGPAPTPSPPGPPAPTPTPAPAPLPQLPCTAWEGTAAWKDAACDKATCVLIMVVDSGGRQMSRNVSPFVAPKAMRLPAANVSVTFGQQAGNRVPITLRSTGTALFVVLTTEVAGRFSDNALLLEGAAGAPTLFFEAWTQLGEDDVGLLKKSLRVEHLAGNLHRV